MADWLLPFTVVFFLPNTVNALECYACSNQDSNKDKCIKTSMQCLEKHDACRTEIKWGLPPYWVPYGERQHYVWKACDTRVNCAARKEAMKRYCKRDWYDDWQCVECCTGDLCNYYVTLGSSSLNGKWTLTLVTAIAAYFSALWYRS